MNAFSSKSARRLCIGCAHFFVTWEREVPYGCEAYGFKSKKTPSMVVYESSGAKCQLYVRRKKKEKTPL